MKKIKPLLEDSYLCYCGIRDLKNEPRLTTLQNLDSKIITCYKEYESKKLELFDLERLVVFDPNENDCLNHCYDNNTSAARKLKAYIRSSSDYCPYCMIHHPSEIDHYLPKSDFPEFSVLNINLLPICTECNRRKLNIWKDTITRTFLNSYFDDIPEQQFLFVDLIIEDDTIKSNFRIDTNGINPTIAKIIDKHVQILNLNLRYNQAINIIISEFKQAINVRRDRNKIDSNEELVKEQSIIEYETQINIGGSNYRKAVLFKEICENKEIIEFIGN